MDAKDEVMRGLTDLEDYLYWDAYRRAAQDRAADFAARVPGLSEGQRADIEWWYVEEQIRASRTIADHVTDQIAMVEARHTERYTRLRRKACVALTLLAGVVLILCVSLVLATMD
ncbi:hypothetical protein [Streptomyces olivaceoviridis]|uniref:hypothetical protein n=1 Tax=Streptomyces olivaceoviridis TaxID=1921 RepID=UPI00331E9EE0